MITTKHALLVLAVALIFTLPAAALDVGDPAPDWTLQDTSGVSYTLSDHLGKVVLINFMGGL